MNILESTHIIYYKVYQKTTLLVPNMYIIIHSHQNNKAHITWIHLVHTCNIYKFYTVTV